MKTAIVLLSCLVAVFAIDVYPTKYDQIDIDAILNNQRLFNNYADCLLQRGKCNEEGGVLREVIPDALITDCSKCNEIQKQKTDKVIQFLIKNRPEVWEALRKLYDPDNKYYGQYSHYLKH